MTEISLPPLALAGCPGVLDNADTLERVLDDAPYLARLARRHPETVQVAQAETPRQAFNAAMDVIRNAKSIADDRVAVSSALRKGKEAAHLAIAMGDLSAGWTTNEVIHAITELAETTCQAALWCAYVTAANKGWVAEKTTLEDTGLFAIAMGKMGAYELNYSSDVDLIILFDPDRFEAGSRSAKEAAVRITQDFSQLMETREADGYVFRVDLRLRPDPSSNAVAISTLTALQYYESVGQNWERMAFIKARVCAGDEIAGADYMSEMTPFIWRRHLDYWAIGDIHAIKRQIHSTGGHEELEAKEFDVKLGRGGIREIEFFAQTQQLILGGRDETLRSRRTDDALDALAGIKAVEDPVAENLKRAYDFLRALEHRIQMRNDEQTHMLPDDADARGRIARLSGYGEDMARFEQDIADVRAYVHGIYSDLFAEEERLSGDNGNLVFTGVDDDPGTVSTLAEMGFSDPPRVIETFRRWHRGGLPATRSARGRQLLTVLTPQILKWMSETGEPDAALERFSDFLSGLRGGVQVFSLMLAENRIAKDMISAMALAPKVAKDLARQPALIDAMLDPSFNIPIDADSDEHFLEDLKLHLKKCESFEDKLNGARRFQREAAFRVAYQILRGQVGPADAGLAYTRLADACIQQMAEAALEEVERKFGEWGGKWAICAMGKLAGHDLSATSDLDIMVVYDPGNPPAPNDLAARFTQRLIAALSAPTEEGEMYEVDMQLRPSGRAGPVAVKLSSFDKYYKGEAWTWEFMALSRIRVVVGDEELTQKIIRSAHANIEAWSSHETLTADILDMRQRIAKERQPKSKWDLKLAEGGLVDIEFVVQHEVLLAAGDAPEVVQGNILQAIDSLKAAGRMPTDEITALRDAYSLQSKMQHAIRVMMTDVFDAESVSDGAKDWLARACGEADFGALEGALDKVQKAVADIRLKKLGPLATE